MLLKWNTAAESSFFTEEVTDRESEESYDPAADEDLSRCWWPP